MNKQWAEYPDLREALEELRSQNQKLQNVNDLKDQWLTLIAKELQDSLKRILGISEMLLEEIQGDSLTSLETSAHQIHRGVASMLRLLNGLTPLVETKEGKVLVSPESLDPRNPGVCIFPSEI